MSGARTSFLLFAIVGLNSATCRGDLIGTLEQVSPTPLTFVQGVDFATFSDFPGNGAPALGDVRALLQAVPGLGDQASDFVGFTPGRIALIERGVAAFSVKVNLAADAGAVGVLIYNNRPGLVRGAFVQDTTIPALTITDVLGQGFLTRLGNGPVEVHLRVVPEPSTLALAGVGGMSLLVFRGWRRCVTELQVSCFTLGP